MRKRGTAERSRWHLCSWRLWRSRPDANIILIAIFPGHSYPALPCMLHTAHDHSMKASQAKPAQLDWRTLAAKRNPLSDIVERALASVTSILVLLWPRFLSREWKKPYLGVCLGMQAESGPVEDYRTMLKGLLRQHHDHLRKVALINFAKDVLGIADATSEEFDTTAKPFASTDMHSDALSRRSLSTYPEVEEPCCHLHA